MSATILGEACLVTWEGETRTIRYAGAGRCSVTQFRDGKKHGDSQGWHPNGQLWYRGGWRADRREGPWEYFGEQGQTLQEGRYADGYRTGLWREHYLSGALLSRGTYAAGKPTGEWIFYDPSGAIDEGLSTR
ncbi:MAG: hypothetical protein O2816_18810 [Planctomycetota bacterium]|nr:hypothetical protein [Planctomycetota bacterium]